MLEAIKSLGEYETVKEGLDIIDQFVEKAKLENTKKVICIVFRKIAKGITYDHTHIEEYKRSESRKYLYRSHQSRRFDVTPTTKIAYNFRKKEPEIEKAFDRIQYWFEKFEDYSKQVEFLKQIQDTISKNKEKILKDISKKFEELKTDKNPRENEKRNSILTIKIQENGKEKYIGDFAVFKNILKEEGFRLIYSRHGGEIRGKGICSLCGNKGEVYDYFPLKIYSVDKRGFAPEFIQKNAWKRLPVCRDCATHLMVGKEFLDKYLLKSFYHVYKFYIIPHFILGKLGNIIEEIKRHGEREEYTEGLLCIEDGDILEVIKNKEDILYLIFVFCEFGQGIKVVKYVEGVPPSWINQLNSTLKEIKNLQIFKEGSLKKIGIKRSGDLKDIDKRGTTIGGLIDAFFPRSKETGVYSEYFIDVIGDILAQRPIDKDLLMNAFAREIRNRHVNEDTWNEKVLTLKSLMLLLFLNRLNLIKE